MSSHRTSTQGSSETFTTPAITISQTLAQTITAAPSAIPEDGTNIVTDSTIPEAESSERPLGVDAGSRTFYILTAVFSGLLVIGLVAFAFFWIRRRRQRSRRLHPLWVQKSISQEKLTISRTNSNSSRTNSSPTNSSPTTPSSLPADVERAQLPPRQFIRPIREIRNGPVSNDPSPIKPPGLARTSTASSISSSYGLPPSRFITSFPISFNSNSSGSFYSENTGTFPLLPPEKNRFNSHPVSLSSSMGYRDSMFTTATMKTMETIRADVVDGDGNWIGGMVSSKDSPIDPCWPSSRTPRTPTSPANVESPGRI